MPMSIKLLLIIASGYLTQRAEAADLALCSLSERATSLLFSEAGGVVQRGPDGVVYFLSIERSTVTAIAPDGSLARIKLSATPEGGAANLMDDLAIDGAGRFFVPAIWRHAPKGGSAGIFGFDSRGNYERTIEFTTRSNVRHIAMDGSGNIFVLGLDPAYFRGMTNNCSLVHEYSLEGKRIRTLSECPAELAKDRQVSGPAWEELNTEVDRGQLWLSGGRLYQLLPVSHQIRIFDPALGITIGQVHLRAPIIESDAAIGHEIVWRIVQTTDGKYVVRWAASGSPTGTGHGAYRFVLALHDSFGRGLSNPLPQNGEAMIPLFANEDGSVTFAAGQASGVIRLLRTLVAVQ